MSVIMRTITGTIVLPGYTTAQPFGTITVKASTPDTVLVDDDGNKVVVGSQRFDCTDGVVNISLPDTSTLSEGARWDLTYRTRAKDATIRWSNVELTANTTIDEITSSDGYVYTPLLAEQVAADAAQVALDRVAIAADAAAVAGVVATTDGIVAPLIPTASGSATSTALSAAFAVQTMNLRAVVTPSGTNDTAAVNAALATFAAAGGGKLVIPRDNWKFTGSTGLALATAANVGIHIEAESDTVFDMTGSTATIGLSLGGSVTGTTAALGADVVKGVDLITCSMTVSAGDILRVQSTDVFNPGIAQPKGELVEVQSSSAGVITLKDALWDSYAAATTTITKMAMPKVSVENLSILRASNHVGLQVQYARDALLGGIYAEGARERLLYVSNVLRGVVDNCGGTDCWYAGTGTSYGLAVASSQSIEEIGNHFRGGRHAVSHGGTFPTRDVKVIGGTFDNYHPSAVPSFDFHGNCENVRVIGATILNGLTSEASNFHGHNLTIRTSAAAGQRGAAFGGDRNSDYVRLTDCDIQPGGASADGVGWIPRGGATAWTVKHVEISGFIRGGATAGAGVRVFPATSGDTGSTIDVLTLAGDIEAQTGFIGLLTSGASVTINTLKLKGRLAGVGSGNAFTPTTSPIGKIIANGDAVITSPNAGFNASSNPADYYLRNAWIEGADRNYFSTGKLHMHGCVLKGFAASGGISAASASEAFISDHTLISVGGSAALPAYNFSRRDNAGKVHTSGAAAPTAGTWKVGDICENTTPATGQTARWECTASGTPGTWTAVSAAVGALVSTTAALAAIGNAINTVEKYAGKTVYNTTTKKTVTADGTTAASAWVDATGTVAHTPV